MEDSPNELSIGEELRDAHRTRPDDRASVGRDQDQPSDRSRHRGRRSELSIDLDATGPCWVEAAADGVGRGHRMMDAGDRATVQAQHEVMLRAGDAAALAFSVNGAPGRPLGEAGRVVTLRIAAENYPTFVAR